MADDPITVTVTRRDRQWVAEIPGYGEATARNLLELVGVVHNLVLLKDNRPRALAFVYPYRAERQAVIERAKALDKARRELDEARSRLHDRLAGDGITAADINRLLDAP